MGTLICSLQPYQQVNAEAHLNVGSGIGRNTRTERESREEEYTVWETRYRGLCRVTEYYVGIPAKRQVEFDREVTTFQLNTDNIKVPFQSSFERSCTFA